MAKPDLIRLSELAGEISTSLQEMISLLKVEGSYEAVDDLMPVQWFSRETYVTADQLRGARLGGRIRAERRGGRWYYSRGDARRLFPDRYSKISARAEARGS